MNDAVLSMAAGCLYHYGVMPARELFGLIQERYSFDIGFIEFVDLAYIAADDPGNPYKFRREENLLYYSGVKDPFQIAADHQARNQLPYYHISEEQAGFAASSQEELLWNPYEERLCAWIKERMPGGHPYLKEAAIALMLEILDAIRNDMRTIQVVQMVAGQISLNSVDEMQVLNDQILEVWDHTPQWSLKGWSIHEATERFGQAWRLTPSGKGQTKKIGRNDPCPCGSGKKYKNCCLDLE